MLKQIRKSKLQKTIESSSVNGYSLFNDIEDKALRIRNRAVCLRNIAVQGRSKKKEGSLTATATLDLIEYFGAVPLNERKEVIEEFMEHLNADGFKVELPNG